MADLRVRKFTQELDEVLSGDTTADSVARRLPGKNRRADRGRRKVVPASFVLATWGRNLDDLQAYCPKKPPPAPAASRPWPRAVIVAA
jgi:hypothetical protein